MRSCEVRFQSGDVSLGGVVWSVDEIAGGAGVVLVGGSGPADRTNDGYFCAIRDHLVAAGVTVLAYDKRGVGTSTGSWVAAGADELAGDVAAAVETLRAHPSVDPRAVGLFGHSEGGWVALRAAAESEACSLTLNSCPAASFVEAEVHALSLAGADPAHAQTLFDLLRQAIKADLDASAAARIIDRAADRALREILARVGFRLTVESYAQLRAWIDYSPDDDLRDLHTPTLAIYGGEDPLTPVPTSLTRLAELAPLTRTRVFPGADHRLQIDDSLAPGYLDLVATWCASPHAAFPVESDHLDDAEV